MVSGKSFSISNCRNDICLFLYANFEEDGKSPREVDMFYNQLNQRTIGPVNAHLISGPSISTKHTKPD